MRTIVVAGVAVVALAGCGSAERLDEARDAADQTTGAGPTLPDVPESGPEPTADAKPPTNERGNLVKALGEEGGMTDADGTPVVSFAIDSIAPASCTSDWAEYGSPPENGHLTGVDVRFSTTPEMGQEPDTSYFTVSSYDFQFIDPDGVTHTNLDTMATYGCLSDSEQFTQEPLNPASQYVGKIVLDLPAPTGTLIYKPSVLGAGEGGWEWGF